MQLICFCIGNNWLISVKIWAFYKNYCSIEDNCLSKIFSYINHHFITNYYFQIYAKIFWILFSDICINLSITFYDSWIKKWVIIDNF